MQPPSDEAAALQKFRIRRTVCRDLWWDPSLSEELLDYLWRAPDELMAWGKPLQDKERCLVVRLDHGADSLVCKRHNWGGPWKTFCKSLRTPQARQSFLDGVFLAAAGVPTPRPLALIERHWGPFGRRSYLLNEFIEGTSLYRLMRYNQPSPALLARIADQIATLCTTLDHLQVSHNDLKPENLMIDPAGQVWLIDLEKMRRHDRLPPVRARLLEDLNRLLHPRNWRDHGSARQLLCQRLLAEPVVAAALRQEKPAKHPLLDEQQSEATTENRLSVLVVAPGNSANLTDCLHAFRDIADEVLVADPNPTEETRALLQAAGGRLVERHEPRETAVDFRNRALQLAQQPWVLVVEGDDRVTPDLAKEIQCLLSGKPEFDAYRISRRRMYLGHVSKYGVFRGEAPERLFRRERGQFVGHRLQARPAAPGARVGRLKSKLIFHFCWRVSDFVQAANERTTRLAELRFAAGEKPQVLRALFRVVRRFCRNYFWNQACLDGRVGMQISLLAAISVLLTEVKLWELHFAQLQNSPFDARPVNRLPLFRTGDITAAAPPNLAEEQGGRRAA